MYEALCLYIMRHAYACRGCSHGPACPRCFRKCPPPPPPTRTRARADALGQGRAGDLQCEKLISEPLNRRCAWQGCAQRAHWRRRPLGSDWPPHKAKSHLATHPTWQAARPTFRASPPPPPPWHAGVHRRAPPRACQRTWAACAGQKCAEPRTLWLSG